MVQNILVFLLVIIAVTHVIYKTVKLASLKRNGSPTCGGCSQCELKKSLVKHGER